MVCIGRPIVWGLAVDGRNGVERVLKMINEELLKIMLLGGYN